MDPNKLRLVELLLSIICFIGCEEHLKPDINDNSQPEENSPVETKIDKIQLGGGYFSSEKNIYYYDEVLPKVDYTTFKFITTLNDPISDYSYSFGKDAKNLFINNCNLDVDKNKYIKPNDISGVKDLGDSRGEEWFTVSSKENNHFIVYFNYSSCRIIEIIPRSE